MKILIIGINFHPEPIGIGPFTTGLSEFLAGAGHEVTVQTSPPHYPKWQVAEGYKNGWSEVLQNGVCVRRAPIYVPPQPSGLKRILHLFSFSFSSLLPTIRTVLRQRPDVVLCVIPSLLSVPLAWLAARLSKAKLWVHIQDFEVEAASATGLLKDGAVLRMAKKMETRLLGSAHLATSISPAMCHRLSLGGIDDGRIYEFRNWADIEFINVLDRPSRYREEWRITAPHVLLYSGNIAKKQGIEMIVEAAERLKHRHDIQFVICGNGANRENLMSFAEQKGVRNILFYDLQPREELNELLGMATIHLLPQLADAADLVLPSKLANMLASGRPVIATAASGTDLADEVEGCGVVVPPGDAAALADAINTLVDDPETLARYGSAARERAVQRWSKSAILAALESRIVHLTT